MPRFWLRITPLSMLLWPAAGLFGLAVALRRALYRCGLLPRVRLAVPVIVIGNLTAGGTGKTPLVLWAARMLAAAGWHPGIVLRGYGGRVPAAREIGAGDDPQLAGDEAVLLASRAACPVWAGADRVAAARGLLAAHPRCNVVLCDDGLQHYRLARDLEIALEDERGHGNGLLLPAGPLREPARRRVDAIVRTARARGDGEDPAAGALRCAGQAPAMFRSHLRPAGLFTLDGAPLPLQSLQGRRLHAVAGIGNPDRFFATLRELGLAFAAHPFPDHHCFTPEDLAFPPGEAILMTEKDAVKCRRFAGDDCYMLRVEAVPDPAFAAFLLEAIHGRQTA